MTSPGARPSTTSRELVLGILRARIPGGTDWRGIRTDGMALVLEAFEVHGEFRPRAEIEDDPTFKQLIPYVVVADRERLFLMRRLGAGGDMRLHDRHSIGVGGHIGQGDGGLAGGLRREWSEELVADWTPDFRVLGLLNDDTDPVGRVHLGVVYRVEAQGRPVEVRETDKLEGRMAEQAEVAALGDRLETWSRLVLEHLTRSMPGDQAATELPGQRRSAAASNTPDGPRTAA